MHSGAVAVLALGLVTGPVLAQGGPPAERFDLVVKKTPLPVTALKLTLVWSHIRAADPVLAWLRGVISEEGRETLGLGAPR